MIGRELYEEDIALKRYATAPKDDKPAFAWREVAPKGEDLPADGVRVRVGEQESDFDIAEIAETVGNALTDLLLSRNEEDIFNEQNQNLVAGISLAVTRELLAQLPETTTDQRTLNAEDITKLIERALVRHNAHDIAKSLMIRRHATLAQMAAQEATGQEGGNNGVGKQLVRVIRRNGEVVAWNQNKIEIAVRKAFLSLHMDSSPATRIAEGMTAKMEEIGQEFIHIEDLQDKVQEELMRQGHFKVAEAYILYRAHRSTQREQDDAAALAAAEGEDPQQDSMILVKKDDGSTFLWDGLDLKRRIEFAMIGLDLCLSAEEIERELHRSLFSEMTTGDLKKTVILNARSLIEKDADFSKFAGRILLTYIYEEVTGWDIVKDGIEALPTFHRKAFKANLVRGIQIERLSPGLQDFDLDRLAEAIDPAADLDFDYLGIQTLYDRYLIVDKTAKPHRRLEAPQLFWMRVAMGLFVNEKENQTEKVIALYNLYKGRRFCSSTPTLFNSGTMHSQLSSCYLYKVDDSIESIMQRGIAENAYLSKWAGGLGGSWTAVRGTGSYIKGTNGESQGVIPFLKLHNDQLVAVNQGGKRRGSGCAYLETWHVDIVDFLELRKNTGDDRRRTHDMNTANWIPDLFMKRMEAREDWTLFRSNEAPDLHDLYGKAFEDRYQEYEARAERGEMFGKKIPAIELWKQMLKMIFETGHPWITFKDPCNVRSPQDHAGVIHSSNLCTEITLNTSDQETAVCNLGSVVLDSHLNADGEIDHEKLRETIRIAVRALDNVIDINFYPTEAAKTANSRHRPVGMGVMGLQNALHMRDVAFASAEAVEFNDEFMEAIAYYAYEASSDLAGERGTYSTYEGSKWDRGLLPADTLDLLEEERGEEVEVPRGGKMDWEVLRAKIAKNGMRNSNVLAIAPTATISNIMGSTPCIEPAYKNLFVRSNLSGDFIVLNQFLVRDLKKLNLWSQEMVDRLKYHDGELTEIDEIPDDLKKKYATAFQIDHEYFIEAAARRQKWIDQSQSVNLFLATPDLKSLSHLYRAAWHKGLKTTYYLRTLGASNIEKATVSVKKEIRGVTAQAVEAVQSGAADAETVKKEYTPEEVKACSIEAALNGEECEACQ
ncbi:MAG: ribonucleoside-diphosphate reductase subunit alpha [Verrucomicrobiota bacterium]